TIVPRIRSLVYKPGIYALILMWKPPVERGSWQSGSSTGGMIGAGSSEPAMAFSMSPLLSCCGISAVKIRNERVDLAVILDGAGVFAFPLKGLASLVLVIAAAVFVVGVFRNKADGLVEIGDVAIVLAHSVKGIAA